jgi:hypothetical protein
MVQEVAIRAKNKVGSIKHLIELLGDTPDAEAELAQIRSEKDIVPPPGGGFGDPGGGSGGIKPTH